MVGIRFLVDLIFEDGVVWLYRDAVLPVAHKGLDVAGLWGDMDDGDAEIVSFMCDVRRPFAVAILASGYRRAETTKDVIPDYLAAGWRVESIHSFDEGTSEVEGDEEDIPWSGPPLA